MHQGNRPNQKYSFYKAESHQSLLATVTPSTSKPLNCLHGSRLGPISVGCNTKRAHWGPCQLPMTHGNHGTQASSHHCLHQWPASPFQISPWTPQTSATVLRWLIQHGLQINLRNVYFGSPNVKFLGYQLPQDGIQPSTDQRQALHEAPSLPASGRSKSSQD